MKAKHHDRALLPAVSCGNTSWITNFGSVWRETPRSRREGKVKKNKSHLMWKIYGVFFFPFISVFFFLPYLCISFFLISVFLSSLSPFFFLPYLCFFFLHLCWLVPSFCSCSVVLLFISRELCKKCGTDEKYSTFCYIWHKKKKWGEGGGRYRWSLTSPYYVHF